MKTLSLNQPMCTFPAWMSLVVLRSHAIWEVLPPSNRGSVLFGFKITQKVDTTLRFAHRSRFNIFNQLWADLLNEFTILIIYTCKYMVTRGYLPCSYRWLCLLFMSHFCQLFHDFKVFYNCPLRSRLGFGPTNILLYWYLQYFLYLTTRSCFNCRSSFFSLVRERSSIHDCSQLFGQICIIWQIASPDKSPNIQHQFGTKTTTRFFFDMQRLWQSFF